MRDMNKIPIPHVKCLVFLFVVVCLSMFDKEHGDHNWFSKETTEAHADVREKAHKSIMEEKYARGCQRFRIKTLFLSLFWDIQKIKC